MKIFNEEDGIRKVYVQINDIMMLNYIDKPIPKSVFEQIFNAIVTIDNNNRNEFISFSAPTELEFFDSLKWLIDYKQVRYLSKEEIEKKCQETFDEIDKLANRYNASKEDNQLLMNQKKLLNYKIMSLKNILLMNQGYKQVSFPIVPDSDGFSFIGDDKCQYAIKGSLNPNRILLFRKDGKKLSSTDKIPQEFLQMGISIVIMESNDKNIFLGDYEINNYLSEDGQYFIIEYKVKNHEKEIKEEKGIKKLVRKVFNNKKKKK